MQKNTRNKLILLDVVLLIVIALTFTLWLKFFFDYYFLFSIVLIIEVIIYALLRLESKNVSAREIAIVATLAVISVVGRLLFFLIPQVKPTAAVVFISGLALGQGPGFIVGLLSMFLSNFVFGQSVNTPFQMLGMGLIGFFAGFLSRLHRENKIKLWLQALIAFVLTFVVYGLVVDSGVVLFMGQYQGLVAVISVYLAGVPFNIVHALSTFIFTLVLSPLLSRQLRRISKKYGLFSLKAV